MRWRSVWGRDPAADVDDELAFHLAERARLNEQRGMTPEQARREAERQFGDMMRIRSEVMQEAERSSRGMRFGEMCGDVVRDVRIGLRALARAPLFTLTAGLALALGIGANSAVFSVVNAVLLRPLPYAEAARVVMVHNSWHETPEGRISPAEYLDYSEQVRGFAAFGVYAQGRGNMMDGDVAQQVQVALVTPTVFPALGITAAAGRVFAQDIADGAAEVVVSHEFWQARFAGAADLVGRDIVLNGTPHRVVGILPEGVRLPTSFADSDPPVMYAPYVIARADDPARGSHFLTGVARLADGATLEMVDAEIKRVAASLSPMYPDDYPSDMNLSAHLQPIRAAVSGESRALMMLLTGAVGLVLLIACANVSALVLTRTEDRRRELAVRSALGAGRGRIARQLLVEHLVLALIAGAVGALIAVAGVRAITLLDPGEIPRLAEARVDGGVLAFTLVLSVVATLLVAFAALRQHSGSHHSLREGGARSTSGRASQRMRRVLIAAEVGLSVVLLAGAGLLLRSFANIIGVDPGYRTEQLLTVGVALPNGAYPDSESRRRFFTQLVDEGSSLPGVTGAGAVVNLPLAAGVGDLGIELEGQPQREGEASKRLDWQVVTPGWFDAMGIEIVRGRGIERTDDMRAIGAVVLSESAAQKYWPDGNAIGARFTLGGGAGPGMVTVVGIARDVRQAALTDAPPAVMYLPHAQFSFWSGGLAPSSMTLVLHAGERPEAQLPAVRDIVRRLDPAVPLGDARTMAQVLGTAVAAPRFSTSLLAAFALLALALVLVGVYGLVGYTVARRTREIAVRMALGAEAGSVVRQIVLQGMRPVLIGAGLGGAAALVLTKTLRTMLYDVAPNDPATLTLSVLLLAATACVACLLPAWRAARIAPLHALREE